MQEAASLGIIPHLSMKASPIVIDAKTLQIHIAEVRFWHSSLINLDDNSSC